MASTCFRAAARMASAASRSAAAARSAPSAAGRAASSAARRVPCFSRIPVELGCCAGLSLLPLHSAVAAARLTSRLSTDSSCRALSQDNFNLAAVEVYHMITLLFSDENDEMGLSVRR